MIWEYKDNNKNQLDDFSKKNHLTLNTAKILLNRGVKSKEELENFINPDIEKLKDPFCFEDMEKAVAKIISKRNNREKIYIYGDYDVDGITSAAFLTIVFRNIGLDVEYYIPNRMEEGYGLNKKAIEYIKNKKGKLIITVDVGINSDEEVKYAKSMGIDIIITDHHKIFAEFKEELTIINPKISNNYSFKSLSGAGVALKLAEAVYIKLSKPLEEIYQYMDIVMIGTVADVVPMIDENRIIIKKGLEIIKNTKIKGLRYLFNYLKLKDKDITTTDVSFFISPMLNALGRIADSNIGVDFFIEQDEFSIYNIIEEMKNANKKRRVLERMILNEVIEQLGESIDKIKYIFLKSTKWHPGVIGVVSARLALKYNIPVLLISIREDIGKASCRSVEGINIFEILKGMSEEFIRFGGHDLAAGFIAKKERLDVINNKINDKIKIAKNCKEDKKIEIEFDIELKEINEKFLDEISILAPFGVDNPQPVFCTRNIYFSEIKTFGVENQHFKAYVKKEGKVFSAVGFNLACKINELASPAESIDIVYYPEKVINNGEEIIQMKIKDFRVTADFDEIFK